MLDHFDNVSTAPLRDVGSFPQDVLGPTYIGKVRSTKSYMTDQNRATNNNHVFTDTSNLSDHTHRVLACNRWPFGGTANRGGLLDDGSGLHECRQGSASALLGGEATRSLREREPAASEAALALVRGKSMPTLGLLRTATDGKYN